MRTAVVHSKSSETSAKASARPFFSKSAEQGFFMAAKREPEAVPEVQTKLAVSSPHDPQEKEADAVADQVMRTTEPTVAPVSDAEEELQRSEEEETETLQTKRDYTRVTDIPVQRQGKDEPLQTKSATTIHCFANTTNTGTPNDTDGACSCDTCSIQRSSRGPPQASASFQQSLSASKGRGSVLPEGTKTFMEGRFNADFSGVRIHTGSHAEHLSSQINAQAFTHGNDIYFNSGKYAPSTAGGGRLLAHELTHTIQQGASTSHATASAHPIRRATVHHGRSPPAIARHPQDTLHRSVIDTALSQVGSVTECITLDLDEAKACAKRKAQQVALYIPGYRALRVVLGHDPITNEHIDRSGRNFIEAAFDVMPGGRLLHQKLEQQQQLDAAAAWIDTQLASVIALVEGVKEEVRNFLNKLDETSLLSPMEALRDGAKIVLRFIDQVIDFAKRAATELLEMVKQFLLNEIVNFIKDKTPAYPLLTVILGEDPITKQRVEPTGTNILNAILELGGEEGIQQRTQMQETGTFEKVAGYIDQGIVVFAGAYEQIIQGFHNIWDKVSIESLMEPTATFEMIYNEFAAPVERVWNFVKEVGEAILTFIKEVLMVRLSAWAKTVRGYPLVTVLIGQDPFTNEEVPPSTENIIRGFFSLMEGGEEQYNQLKESGAIDQTVQKVEAAVTTLGMTPAYIVQLFTDLWNSFSLTDLANPFEAFQRIIDRFGEPIGRLIAFVVEIVKIVIEAVLIVMNFPFDVINNIIAKAMEAFELIKRDPVGFLKNLLRAIKQGFEQFFGNILQHLLGGLVGWLTSELRDSGAPELTDLSLRGIIAWVLEILGITMEKIWEKLAAHPRIGPERVARIRGMIGQLEGIWTFIKDVQERGMAAIWDKIAEQLSNLWDTILNSIKNWIMEQIVNKMVAKLLSMLDPTGIMAVVNSVIALYNAIQSFIKYLREMLEIVNSFVEGVVEIASGNISTAANFVERSMARSVPVVIGFLANQLSLSGIGQRIGQLIGRAREMVDEALTWLVNKAVDTGLGLLDRVMGRTAEGETAEGETDERTMEEKQADVNHATDEAQVLLDRPDVDIDQVENQLPDIKDRYRLNRIELVSSAAGKYHVDVEINPKKSTDDRFFGADGSPENPYPIYWPEELEHPNPALGDTMHKVSNYERDTDLSYQIRQREQLFQWLAMEDRGEPVPQMRSLRRGLRARFGITARITAYTLGHHLHHYRPLFLNGPDEESNLGLLEPTAHSTGHSKLRLQTGAPAPPEGMPYDKRNLYDMNSHPLNTYYRLAGMI